MLCYLFLTAVPKDSGQVADLDEYWDFFFWGEARELGLCIWITTRLHGYRCGGSGGGMATRRGNRTSFGVLWSYISFRLIVKQQPELWYLFSSCILCLLVSFLQQVSSLPFSLPIAPVAMQSVVWTSCCHSAPSVFCVGGCTLMWLLSQKLKRCCSTTPMHRRALSAAPLHAGSSVSQSSG